MKKLYEMPQTEMVRVNTEYLLTAESQLNVNRDGETVESVDDLLSRGVFGNLWADDELADDDSDLW